VDSSRRRGRPAEGRRVAVRLPPAAIAALDARAAVRGTTRAHVLRDIVAGALEVSGSGGVDRAQIRRMLEMTPAERVRHLVAVANTLARFQGSAVRR